MNFLRWSLPLSLLSHCYHCCVAFLPPPTSPSSIIFSPLTTKAASHHKKIVSNTRLHGIQEWRDEALEYKYTLDSYQQQQSNSPSQQPSNVPAVIPVLPFPFTDILLQGQRTQLNLYEQRFHKLFQDAVDNHHGMVGMGLLAGNGMITTLPLCEVESFTKFGADENWVDTGNGMGNGSIFVTIRAVGRVKIVEDDLLQEEPYMKARVVELLDEDANMVSAGSGLKEEISGISNVRGESSALEVASTVAGTVENLMVSLASLEHKMKEMEERKLREKRGEGEDEVMNRRLVNAQLESLFMNDSTEGVDLGSSEGDAAVGDAEEDQEDDFLEGGEADDEKLDRVAQFQKSFESAKETDTFGYVLQPSDVIDNLSQPKKGNAVRTPKDLTAVSWAAFCTGDPNDIERDVMKVQALDMLNVMQRLQLASAMLREEKKKLRAKLALMEMKEGKDES